jgi:hypothetical protein
LNAAKAYLVGYKENSELGAGVGANQAQAGLLQGAKRGAGAHASSGKQQAEAAVGFQKLHRREASLQAIFKKEERSFESRQPYHKQDEEAGAARSPRRGRPVVHSSAMLQQWGRDHAGEERDASGQLLHRLGRLQAVEKQIEDDFYQRQSVHRPQMVPEGSRLQETNADLTRRLQRLRAQSKEEHEAFLQSARGQ